MIAQRQYVDEVTIDGGNVNCAVHVELFGPVTLVIGDDRIFITGYSAQLVALLAGARGAPVAATQLLDSLWPEAPSSGLNVVQRHLSALRRRLRASGHRTTADRLIVHRGGTYLLDPAVTTTDLDLLDAPDRVVTGPSDTGDGPPPRWWDEPLAGLPWEPFVPLRAVLDRVAVEAAHRWLTAHRSELDPATISMAVSGLARRHPGDELPTCPMIL